MNRPPRERAWSGRLRWTWLHTAAAAWTAGGLLRWYASPWELVRLFGGTLLSCKRIRGHYYRCWFT